ncbi:hypothetical protein ABG067_002994 [Albugo candida]|uniref:TAFII55 protein conserved region domain-containing protein n=1 Tax=Albugo candida TaxID=65357 RepID=A0A024GLA1_9STRA|nr:unnamed protein product [Albugo candida]|eukprot:CCI47489.1 unnamed protein product [Albugo candida]
MEQYLLQVPKNLAGEIRSHIANGTAQNIQLVSKADNRHFTFVLSGKEYFAKIAQLPCVLETHKTYDDNFFYKSGEIGQMFIVCEKEDEKEAAKTITEISNGITPPNTNVVKRKYEKTKHYTPFPKPDVARVEEDLIKILQGGPFEEVEEELVEFHDWMVDEAHPNGLIVTDEMELIRQHPEYLNLTLGGYTEEEMDRLQLENELESAMDLDSAGAELEDLSFNHISDDNVPPMTHAPLEMNDEIELQTSRDLEGSSCLAPRASPSLSQDDDGVDDLENELLDGLDEKSAAGDASYQQNPNYLELVATRERLQKCLQDSNRNIFELAAKVDANSNIVVKNRFKQMLETTQAQKAKIAQELVETVERIKQMETV